MKACGLAPFCLAWVALAGCREKPMVPVKNPAYLELRPVSTDPLPGYLPVQSGDGRTVHASPEVIVDLRDFDCGSATVVPVRERPGEFSLILRTTRQGGDRLMEYTEGHIAEPIGVFIDGNLFMWATIGQRFGSKIQILKEPPLGSAEAHSVRTTIAAGGALE